MYLLIFDWKVRVLRNIVPHHLGYIVISSDR